MELERIDADLSVCKIKKVTDVNFSDEYWFLSKTDEELSLVCQTKNVPSAYEEREDGWKAFRIQGILDFSLVGILAEISSILANDRIGIFAISTYNTDYILVKEVNFERALDVLKYEGYHIK